MIRISGTRKSGYPDIRKKNFPDALISQYPSRWYPDLLISVLTICLIVFSICGIIFPSFAADSHVRTPFVSGSFYPTDSKELESMIDGFFSKVPPQKPLDGKLVALIAPHAGYVYSGQTAAYSYRLLAGSHYDTVVLIGPYHRAFFPGASIWGSGIWKTPLGEVAIDEELARAIITENSVFEFTDDAHLAEHSLETQVPFLQKSLENFKIVPILVSNPSPENTERIAKAVFKNIKGKKALIIASTDMSHYYADNTARKMDRLTLDLIQKKDSGGLLREMKLKNSELCGEAAVLTVLEIAKLMGGAKVQLLHYSNSGDTTRDKARVVGYGALAIYQTGLNAAQKKELLSIARQTVETYVKTGQILEPNVTEAVLKEDRGVFVTLKKEGQLRGCIGTILPKEPLYLAVRNMAIQSAVDDPRFRKVDTSELKDLSYEISVLSVPKRVPSAEHIVLGKHGVILKKASRQGVFLPKVAEETAWDKEAFLGELCSQKAGLPWDCWKDPATELYTFTAQEFGE